MTIFDVEIGALTGGPAALDRYRGAAVLVVNVASRCGQGYTGDVRWNFEKFLVAPDGTAATRFPPQTGPQDGGLTAAVEKLLPR